MTPTSAVADLYTIALKTGARKTTATEQQAYWEILDDLHSVAGAIVTGADPQRCVNELAAEWRATANLCGSHVTAALYRRWAEMLEVTSKVTS